jgi:hypothetical protein
MSKTPTVAEQTDHLFRAIGRVVVRFQQVEQWLAEELAVMLRMRERDDQHLVSAAMSFKQKVDLLVALYPKRKAHDWPEVDISAIRRALYAAEEFRNRVVHSFWAIECGDKSRWVRIKGSLRGRGGFSSYTVEASSLALEECCEALTVICEWIVSTPESVDEATAVLTKYLQTTVAKTK